MEVHRQINVATRIVFPIVDADGDTVTAAAALDSESTTWNDGANPGAFADLTNEATEIGVTGIYYLILTAAEMNFDYIAIRIQTTTTGAKTQHILINTRFAPLVNASGRVDVGNVAGTAQTAGDIIARLPAALVGGRMDASVGAMAANVLTAAAINADAITAAKIADGAIDRGALAADTGLQTIRSNTAAAGAAGTITLDAGASATDSFYNGCLVYITGATGVGQYRLISSYAGATKVATITPNWITNPDATSTFAILPAGMVSVEAWLRVVVNALIAGRVDANAQVVGDKTGYSLTQTFPTNFSSMVIDASGIVDADVRQWLGTAVNALIAGRVDASVGAMAAAVIGAAAFAAAAIDANALAADAVDEIWDELMVEQAQGIPGATPAFRTVLAYLYMALRNAITQDGSFITFSNDAGTVIWKKATTDAAGVYTEAEGVSGP